MKVGVYGGAGGEMTEQVKINARAVGRRIAELGGTVVTGSCPGLPYEAVLAAAEVGGKCIGYSPARKITEHVHVYKFPTEGFSEIIYIPDGIPVEYADLTNPDVAKKFRNVPSVASTDAVVIIGGRVGTMNEFTTARDLGKRTGVLEGSGGITKSAIKALLADIDKPTKSVLIFDADPISLVDQLLKPLLPQDQMLDEA